MKATRDSYESESAFDEQIERVDTVQACQMVASLDGKVHTMLSLDDDSGWTLTIGGGPNHFVIGKTDGDGVGWMRINPFQDTVEPIELVTGGQLSEFDADCVCTAKMAVDAIEEFFASPTAITDLWKLA